MPDTNPIAFAERELTVEEISRIARDALLKIPCSIDTPKAHEIYAKCRDENVAFEENGLVVEFPYDL